MNIVFLAPLPPPFTGNSLAAKISYEQLAQGNNVILINLNKKSLKSGTASFGRIIQIAGILWKVKKAAPKADAIYFSVTESMGGNLKDLLIYLCLYKKLDRVFIHMLGGAGMRVILSKKNWQFKLNKFFMKRLCGVIVEGEPQVSIFLPVIDRNKIHIVPNFAEDFLFATEKQVTDKFVSMKPLKILYLSNLLYGKGYEELLDAYLNLDRDAKNSIKLTFIGGFDSYKAKAVFLEKIDKEEGITYQSFVSGEEKKKAYLDAHVFCLPTYYPYEGQPISILEAYACGCVAVLTNHSGIPQIFKDHKNGYLVEPQSPYSIKRVIEYMLQHKEDLHAIGLGNRNEAFVQYRTSRYKKQITEIVLSAYPS